MTVTVVFTLLFTCTGISLFGQGKTAMYEPVSFADVTITDPFWKPRLDKLETKTLEACIYQTEIKTPRIRNFEKIVRKKGEKHEGIYYDDSDVYKALEAMGYSLKNHRDSSLESTADRWIDIIAAAQMADGYLFTYYQLGDINKRWTEIEKHEDYCAGHLIEAAIAYYNATGKRKLLNVAIRVANHIDSVMRLGQKKWFSGHQEIELALMKLYHLTKDERYLKLADWYLQQRGQHYYTYGKSWFTPGYWQDELPVKDQKEITGHAVRAMYLYTGAADVAAVTGDQGYLNAMKTVWEDVVYRNMYVTGGIGSAGDNEGFSKDYDLPNEDAYCETCASVGMVFWNQRMNLLTGESKYIDVLERSLYNGALDGLSLSGDRFFYDNPLASNGQHQRKAWFGTACCPANISRLVASVGDYIYSRSGEGIRVQLYIGSSARVALGSNKVQLYMDTWYPWDGQVNIRVDLARKQSFTISLRIPGWAVNEACPGDAYRFSNTSDKRPVLTVNGKPLTYRVDQGYAIINRTWNKGDKISWQLPMETRLLESRSEISANRNRVAIQRGPLIYCIEGRDNGNEIWNLVMDSTTGFQETLFQVQDEKVVSLEFGMLSAKPASDGQSVLMEKKKIRAIPYYCWANRGGNEMQVWLPTRIENIKINYSNHYPDGGNY